MARLLMLCLSVFAFSTFAFSQPESAAGVVFTGNVDPASIPTRITDPIPNLTNYDALTSRILLAGNVTFRNARMTIGVIDNASSSEMTIVAKALRLEGSAIKTNGNKLVIYCETLAMDNASQVFTFLEEDLPEAPALGPLDGLGGISGDHGGEVLIHVLNGIEPGFRTRLRGQSGGPGGNGTLGAVGAQGSRGRNARNGDFGTCRRGAGNGGRGGVGGTGGRAGTGGTGGAGGRLRIVFINREVPLNLSFAHDGTGGRGGLPGTPGAGGPGGPGGRRGRDAGNCRIGGRNGPQGPDGAVGQEGSVGENGTDSSGIVEAITLPQR